MTVRTDIRLQTPQKEPAPLACTEGPHRRCFVTGERSDTGKLVRFALDAQDNLVLDLAGTLPGHGIWVAATRQAMERVAGHRYLSRQAGAAVHVPDRLADLVEGQLRKRCLGNLGLAMRARQVAIGADAVRRCIRDGNIAVLVIASDAARDGRDKLIRLARSADSDMADPPVVGMFAAKELGAAVGRDMVTHAALGIGRLADKFMADVGRLAGLIQLDPAANWRGRGSRRRSSA